MDSRVSGLSLGRSRVACVVLLVDAAAWIIHRPFEHRQPVGVLQLLHACAQSYCTYTRTITDEFSIIISLIIDAKHLPFSFIFTVKGFSIF